MNDELRQGRINHARLVAQAQQRTKISRESIKLANYSPREHAQGEKSYVSPEEAVRALGLLRNHEKLATSLVYKMIDGKPAHEAAREAANAGIERHAIRAMIARTQRLIDEVKNLQRPVLSPMNNGYVKSFDVLDLVKAEKAPSGFTDFNTKIPGGKRKPKGSGYEYWYPGQGVSGKPHEGEGRDHHDAHRKDLERQLSESRAQSKPSPEVHAKFMELAQHASDNGIRVGGKHPNGSHTMEDMERFERRLNKAIAKRKSQSESPSGPSGQSVTDSASESDNQSIGSEYDGLSPREQVKVINESSKAFGAFIADMKNLGLETASLETAHKRLETVLKRIGADSDNPVVKPSERETLKQLAGSLRWMVLGMLTGFLAGGGHAGIAGLAAGSTKAMIDQKGIKQVHKETLQRFSDHKEMHEASRAMLAEFNNQKDAKPDAESDAAPALAKPEDRPHFGGSSEPAKPSEPQSQPNREARRAAKRAARAFVTPAESAESKASRKARRKQQKQSRRRNRAKKSLFIDTETDLPVFASPLDLMKADSYKVPAGARGNARKVLEWKQKHGTEVKGMTSVGWARARQLASQSTVGLDTVKRMSAFNRHRKNAAVDPKFSGEPWKDRGYVAWLGWGGSTGVDWARRITGALDKAFTVEDVHDLADSAGVRWNDNPEFMDICENLVGKRHLDDMDEPELRIVADAIDKAIDIEARLTKAGSDAKKTPAEPHERTTGSSKNKPGSAATGSGSVTLSAATIETLKSKVKEHNESSEKKVTLGKLKAVYRRGSGAFSTSHHPNANRHSWSMGRVNSFLQRVKGTGGHPQDDDLISKAGPFVGPRGGKWADAKHTIPWKEEAESGQARSTGDNREMSRKEAITAIQAGLPKNVRAGWLRNADRAYKPQIAEAMDTNPELKNAGLNMLHQQYQISTDRKIPFSEFLDTPIVVYRAGVAPNTEAFTSYSHDRQMAEKFSEQYGVPVESVTIKPRDTFGMINEMAEGEVLVPKHEHRGKFKQGETFTVRGHKWKVVKRGGLNVYLQREDKPDSEPMRLTEDRLAHHLEGMNKAGPFIGPRGGKWADSDHTIPYKPTSGSASGKKPDDGKKPKRPPPASQLPEDVQAKLKALGIDKLPPHDVPADQVHLRLDGDPHATAVIKWRDAKNRLQSGYTPEFHKRNAAKKWARIMEHIDQFKGTKRGIHKALAKAKPGSTEHQAALVSAIIAHTGLRPGRAASAQHGHFGVSTLTPAHVAVDGNKVSFEFVGKQGKVNTATIRNSAIAQAMTPYLKGGNKRNQPMFDKGIEKEARKVLPKGLHLKDMRTIVATQHAMGVLDKVITPPPLTGNVEKDKRLLAKALLAASTEVADLINNTPTVARESYVHPEVFRKWAIDRAGAKPALFEEV